ncbi:hypothetical protein B0T09DRAFT_32902 [Sordaria sp. MPI-SDFR-AT-0083]|nr:hypothetical protein B0T09DRAFT_32902 [Sordaria sp. MPI-SDFR-AT-0083]
MQSSPTSPTMRSGAKCTVPLPKTPRLPDLQHLTFCKLRGLSTRAASEYRKNVDMVLRDELGAMYVNLPDFHDIFFGRVAGLKTASEAVFNKCTEGSELLFRNDWRGWPTDANQQEGAFGFVRYDGTKLTVGTNSSRMGF